MPDSNDLAVQTKKKFKAEDRLIGATLCAFSAAGFASLTIMGKVALVNEFNVMTLLGLRYGGAALILIFYLRFVRGKNLFTDRRPALHSFLLGAIIAAGATALYFEALRRIPASLNSLLFYVYPIFVAFFGWMINRRAPTLREWIAILITSLGIVLTLGINNLNLPDEVAFIDPIGIVMVVGSAIGYALYILCNSRIVQNFDPWMSTTWIMIGAATSYCTVGFFAGAFGTRLAVNDLWLLLGMILLGTIFPTVLLLTGLRRVDPTTASLVNALEPVFTVLLAVLLLREGLSFLQVMGGGLVLTAAILVTLPQHSR
jgi:drug/metabolite transporter (DMT)-like permease